MADQFDRVDRVEMLEEAQAEAAFKSIAEREAKSTHLDTPQGQKYARKDPSLPAFFKSNA